MAKWIIISCITIALFLCFLLYACLRLSARDSKEDE